MLISRDVMNRLAQWHPEGGWPQVGKKIYVNERYSTYKKSLRNQREVHTGIDKQLQPRVFASLKLH